VSTVCSSALLWCLVDLDVLNDQVAGIETLGVCVCFGVLQETEKEFSRLDGPSGTGDTELLSYTNSSTLPDVLTKAIILVPCAARPVPPAYRLMGTASLCSWTFSRNLMALWSFQPLIACAVSRVFLKETRRYAPRALADFAGEISVAAYRT
jgi:hypothetical protein